MSSKTPPNVCKLCLHMCVYTCLYDFVVPMGHYTNAAHVSLSLSLSQYLLYIPCSQVMVALRALSPALGFCSFVAHIMSAFDPTSGGPLAFLVALHEMTEHFQATQIHLHVTGALVCRAIFARMQYVLFVGGGDRCICAREPCVCMDDEDTFPFFVKRAMHWFLCVEDMCVCPGPRMVADIIPYMGELVPTLCICCGLTSFPRGPYPPDRCICNCTPCVCGLFIHHPELGEGWTDPASLPPTTSQLFARRQVVQQQFLNNSLPLVIPH